jgi:hypothetical protein
MFIAAIDPGVKTGLVISNVLPRNDIVTIAPVVIDDIVEKDMIIPTILQYHCRNIFMEQKPAHPSPEGLDNWEFLFHGLLGGHNYHLAKTKEMKDCSRQLRMLFLVQPSHWKPFMKNRKALLPKPLPHHAKDAFMLLHYSLQINYPDKEIVYAK